MTCPMSTLLIINVKVVNVIVNVNIVVLDYDGEG